MSHGEGGNANLALQLFLILHACAFLFLAEGQLCPHTRTLSFLCSSAHKNVPAVRKLATREKAHICTARLDAGTPAVSDSEVRCVLCSLNVKVLHCRALSAVSSLLLAVSTYLKRLRRHYQLAYGHLLTKVLHVLCSPISRSPLRCSISSSAPLGTSTSLQHSRRRLVSKPWCSMETLRLQTRFGRRWMEGTSPSMS